MKKKVLMPLLVASMMVASVVSLDSCKKEKEEVQPEQTPKEYFESIGAPFVEEVMYRDNEYELYKVCPYCHDTLFPDVLQHWHAFGTPPEGYDWSLLNTSPHPEDEPRGVADCLEGAENFCHYSGVAVHNEQLIQFFMNKYGISHQMADWMTLPRFHGHNISYVIGSTEGNASGYHNDMHVGGGVPFWPVFGSDPNKP